MTAFGLHLNPTSNDLNYDAMEPFCLSYDVVVGYVVQNVVATRNGTHQITELLGVRENGTVSLLEPLAIEVANLPCSPPETHPNQDGNICFRAHCDRGSELTSDLLGCLRCGYGQFADDGNGHSRQCELCPGSTICDALGCVTCVPCGVGQQPNAERTSCESCPTGTAGVGVCVQPVC